MTATDSIRIRPARTSDVKTIMDLMTPLVEQRILLGKDLVVLYGSVQEFLVAVNGDDEVIGYGALHAMWEHIGEIRTLGVAEDWLGHGVGHRLLLKLEER